MPRLLIVPVVLAALLGCDTGWSRSVALDHTLERYETAGWDVEIGINAATARAVARDGGDLSVEVAIDARYPFIFGPPAGATVYLAERGQAGTWSTLYVPRSREEFSSVYLDDLLRPACSAVLDCQDDGDGACDDGRCTVQLELWVDRDERPGRLRTWLDVRANLDPAADANADFSLRVNQH